MKSERTLRRAEIALRKLIDTTMDPVEMRIAYGMEIALRWARLPTVGWPTMDKEAKSLAAMLHSELRAEEKS